MESTDTVNVRLTGDTADALARRAQAVGLSRQEYVDQVLRREALYGSEPWARVAEVAPGLLPISAALEQGIKVNKWAFIYRDLSSGEPVILLGKVERVSPLVLYARPDGHRTVPVARANLIAWEPYATDSDLFEIVPGWFYAGARLHPTIPQRWVEQLMPQLSGDSLPRRR